MSKNDLEEPLAPRDKRRKKLTNEEIFERHRSAIESSLKHKLPWEDHFAGAYNPRDIVLYFAKWAYRYLRRQQDIERMLDVPAHDALLARNSTHDAAVQGDPGWDGMDRMLLTANYAHPETEYDVNSVDAPHSYGPSFRRLCIEGRPFQWGTHRPPAWDEEDQRKSKGLAYATPELREPLSRELSWHKTDDVDHPWSTQVGEETWRIRLNDFPDDLMYTLIINDRVIGKFHDWPQCWQRK